MTTLQQFFKEQKKQVIDTDSKMEIYHDILRKKQKSSITQRLAVWSKTVLYTSLSAILVASFIMISQEESPIIVFDDESVQIQQASDNPYRMSADSIGQVMQFQGSYTISNGGKFFQTNMIYDGDIIELQKEAFLSFKLNDHTTRVIGPARVEVFTELNEKGEKEFFVHVLEGEFVEIVAPQSEKSVTVQKNDVAIHKTEQTKELKVQIVEEKGQTKIRNLGDTIHINAESEEAELNTQQEAAITKKEENSQAATLLVEDEETKEPIARINIASITTQEASGEGTGSTNTGDTMQQQREEIIALLETNEKPIISKSTEENEENTTSGVVKEDNVPTDTALPGVSVPVADILIDGKKVPNEQQAKELKNLLQRNFLEYDIKSLMSAMAYHKENGLNITLNNINSRLNNVANVFEMKGLREGATTEIIMSNSSILIQYLSEEYHIPPNYIHNLVSLQQWIIFLQDKELELTTETIDMQKLINKIYQQKTELHFK